MILDDLAAPRPVMSQASSASAGGAHRTQSDSSDSSATGMRESHEFAFYAIALTARHVELPYSSGHMLPVFAGITRSLAVSTKHPSGK